MNRSKKLSILLGVLAVVCIAAFAALHLEEKQEQIKSSGETVLSIDPEEVQTLSWIYEDESLSFHRDGETWLYDEDEAFPVDSAEIQTLLEQFQSFAAAFTIEEVEDFDQYGLEDPVCTIDLATEDQSWQITLGSYSSMDAQRYVSIGDGNVYLAVSDPLDVYDTELSDLIDNDETPTLTQAEAIQFEGAEMYHITYVEDSADTYCADDVYFTQSGGENLPLDTSRVKSYLSSIRYLSLTDYVTYNATDEELYACGLDDPELTVTVDYTYEDEDGETAADTFVLHISRSPEDRAAEDSGEEEADAEITAYARVGDSPILYRISSDDYQSLMAASYDDLRHQEIFPGDFGDVTQLDISLDGAEYTLSSVEEDGSRVWSYLEEELEIDDLQDALESLSAAEFTSEKPSQAEEVSVTLHLDNENFPEVQIDLYRYDGSSCLAVVDGVSTALISRSQAVDLMEAVRSIVLN